MRLTKYLLVVAGGLAIAGLVIWQQSPVTSSLSADLSAAAGQYTADDAIEKDVAPAALGTDGPKAVTGKDTATVVIRKRPTPRIRREPPAAVSAEVAETAPPPPAITAPDNELPRLTYEQRVTDATGVADEDSDRALVVLQQLSADEPGRPEAYEAMAGIRLRNREYGKARDVLTRALDHGGKATFALIHDHTRGNFDLHDPKATCVGELTILGSEVRFDSPGTPDRFASSWAEVRDAGPNKFFGSGIGGFHVTITADGKYRNFNLAPQSRDKAEGKLILDLLRAYARRP